MGGWHSRVGGCKRGLPGVQKVRGGPRGAEGPRRDRPIIIIIIIIIIINNGDLMNRFLRRRGWDGMGM